MSTLNLRRILTQLNRVDLDKVEYSYLVKEYRAASAGVSIPLINKTEVCFRSRITDAHIVDVSDLGPPPAALVTGFQRCNAPGIPYFYGASKRITALLECNVQPGDVVYLSQWVSKDRIPINCVLTPEKSMGSLSTNPLNDIFHTHLDTIFTRPIHNTFNNAYKPTAAVAEFLTSSFSANTQGVGDDGLVALSYPSVANIADGYNIAMRGDFAAANLQILHVTKLRILDRTGKSIRIEILDTANEFDGGRILWLNCKRSIPILRDKPEGFLIVSNGRDWLMVVRADDPSEEDLEQFLLE